MHVFHVKMQAPLHVRNDKMSLECPVQHDDLGSLQPLNPKPSKPSRNYEKPQGQEQLISPCSSAKIEPFTTILEQARKQMP